MQRTLTALSSALPRALVRACVFACVLLSAIILGTSAAHASNGTSVMNQFIATFAKDEPSWKTEIAATADPTFIEPGKQLGYSRMLGYYTFRPKLWEEFTELEKRDLLKDARMKAFIISLRSAGSYPAFSASLAEAEREKVAGRFPVEGGDHSTEIKQQTLKMPTVVISPDEMVRARPVHVFLYNLAK